MLSASFTRTSQIKVSQLVKSQMLTEKYDKAKTEGCFVDELTDEFVDAIAGGDRLERVGKWQVGYLRQLPCEFFLPSTHTHSNDPTRNYLHVPHFPFFQRTLASKVAMN